MGFLSKLFGGLQKVNLKDLVKQGAIILDVRTPAEFQGGHIKGSINMPLQTLNQGLKKLKKEQTIITCCASGMRSSSAKSILKSNGFEAHNGGGWTSLQAKLK
jgi:phage shock protein E